MSFSWGKGDLFVERIGEHVLEHLIPLRRLLDAGLTVACGTDWGPKNVFEHIALASHPRVLRQRPAERRPGAGVTRAEALAMWTRDAARVLRWEGDRHARARQPRRPDRRRPRPARRAPVEDLPGTQVLATLLGGEAVHDAGLVTA